MALALAMGVHVNRVVGSRTSSLLQASIHTLTHLEEREPFFSNPGFDVRVHGAEIAGEMRLEAVNQVHSSG